MEDLLAAAAAASAAEHITEDKGFDKEDEYDVFENMDGQGGTANDMKGGEHVENIRGTEYDNADANVADLYNDKDADRGEVEDTAVAAPTNDDEEIVEGAGEGNNLPPLGDQFMTTGADEHGAPPLYVPYIEPIGGVDRDYEGDEEEEKYRLDGHNLQAPPVLGEQFAGDAGYAFDAQMMEEEEEA